VNLRPFFVSTATVLATAAMLCAPAGMWAQTSSSSSSSTPGAAQTQAPGTRLTTDVNPVNRPLVARIAPGGAEVTLEYSEPLFQVAAGLNACGYDADLSISSPVRQAVRDDMNAALAQSADARESRDKLCAYIRLHRLNDIGLDIGQYVSLALYLSPPPELTPNVSELELPPQAASVVNVLPLLRDFADQVNLHFIWLQHRAAYEALAARVHDPMADMIQETNLYLHQQLNNSDGRRFLVLLEPMLSPNLSNARVYGSDYIVVLSPQKEPAGSTQVPVNIAAIRHIYLHYVVEPMVYSRGAAMERIQPMLRAVQDAPLEFSYKSDVVALITECLIKAIEARMYVIDAPKPKPPRDAKIRSDFDSYNAAIAIYDKQTAVEQQKLVLDDEAHGWVLTSYFYGGLGRMKANGAGLRDEIAPMIYSMDVGAAERYAESVQFAKDIQYDPLRPAQQPRKLEGMDLAEMDLMKGQVNDAADLAEAAMQDPKADHARASYLLARIELMQGDPDKSIAGFQQTLKLSKDPRTMAWSHIYLGRLYDIESPPARDKAIAEYNAALAVRDSAPDTKAAAESGLAKPFQLPQRAGQPHAEHTVSGDDDKDFDPTGKAEKQAYKPPTTPPGM
jgi:tetratricopeptide (TPR) repeat protein